VAAPGEHVVSLGPDGDGLIDTVPGSSEPTAISGTSYAAPVVSGVAALVRAVSPRLTARQVMRRIEDTARHPSSGWDPWVGHGVVDALAAVSADGPRALSAPLPAPVAQATPEPGTADAAPRRVSLIGAAACVAVTATATTFSAGWLRRRRETVTKH